MPTVAGWIDDLRAAFGADMIGRRHPRWHRRITTFTQREGSHEVGADPHNQASAVRLSDIGWSADESPQGTR